MNKLVVITAACAALALSTTLTAGPAGAQQGGTVSGTVKYEGTAPKPKEIAITKDKEVCAKEAHHDESLVVGEGGGLANAVVVVKGAKGELKPEEVKFDQNGCRYHPHVLAFPAGSTVDILNSDGILHNIHTYSKENPSFNMAQPKFKKEIKKQLDKAEVVKVTCDAHGWMRAWWYVADTPYYAVTDDKGNFTINNVPPGDYTVEAWQEELGTVDQKVEVKPGATATVNFSMKPKG